jgi:hypothetical protein
MMNGGSRTREENQVSAAILRQAAALLCQRVAQLPMGAHPWRIVGTDSESEDGIIVDGTAGDDGWLVETHSVQLAQYIATLTPAVALALAACMEQVAWMGRFDPDLLHRVGCPELVAVAQAILGDKAPPPEGIDLPEQFGTRHEHARLRQLLEQEAGGISP